MPCIVAGSSILSNMSSSKFEKSYHAYMFLWKLMACGMGACYACVWFMLRKSDAKNLYKGPSSLPEKSSSRRLPCQRLNQKIV